MTTEPGPPSTSNGRTVVLGVVAFAATLVLLLGFASLISQGAGSRAAFAGTGAPAPPDRPRRACRRPRRPRPARPHPTRPRPPRPPRPGSLQAPHRPRSPTPSWWARATSPTAPSTTTRRRPPSSRRSRGPCSPPVTTPTRTGRPDQFRDCYDPTWGAFKDRTRPAAGNHDWETKDLAGYLGYFGEAAAPQGVSWYSYELGAWHVVVLDSDCAAVGGCEATSPQGRWLAADLAASDATCTLAIWHHPRFSSGFHGNIAEVGPVLAGAVRRRRGRRHQRARPRLRTVRAPGLPTPRSTRRTASASSSSAPAERPCGRSRPAPPTASCDWRPATASSGSTCARTRTTGRSCRPRAP